MVQYTPNRAGLRALLASPGVQRALRVKAERVKARAEAIAPVRTGHYKASFDVESGVRGGKAYGRVINRAPYARFVEFGTRYMKKQRILGRALDAARD